MQRSGAGFIVYDPQAGKAETQPDLEHEADEQEGSIVEDVPRQRVLVGGVEVGQIARRLRRVCERATRVVLVAFLLGLAGLPYPITDVHSDPFHIFLRKNATVHYDVP